MKTISVNGENYVKGTDIAKELGYTADYVGQLCRGGEVEATKVGRTWYVQPDSIREHKKTRYRSTNTKTKVEIAKVKENDNKRSNVTTFGQSHWLKHNEQNFAYEEDTSDLIPKTIKVKEEPEVKKEKREEEPTRPVIKRHITEASSKRTEVPVKKQVVAMQRPSVKRESSADSKSGHADKKIQNDPDNRIGSLVVWAVFVSLILAALYFSATNGATWTIDNSI